MSGPTSLDPLVPAPAASRPESRREALKDAARQLEGVFVSMMFEEMAKGTGEQDGLFPKTPGRDMYQQWFRKEIADQFARDGGLGLGDTIAGQLEGRGGGQPRVAVTDRLRKLRPKTASAAPTDSRRRPPVRGPVTSGFGPRVHPVTGERHVHHGVDIAVPSGTSVRSPYAGRISKVAEGPLLGLHVIVEHRGGYRSLYAHLSETSMKAGQRVNAGAAIGLSGASGRTTGPHLHFALYRHGQPVDPGRWIQLRSTF